jgi:hypothetical protein
LTAGFAPGADLTVAIANVDAMTKQHFDFTLNRPAALIAAVPAVLGFVPEKSLVLVTIERGRLGCVLRVDLSPAVIDSLSHLAEVASAAGPDAAVAVIVDGRSDSCPWCAQEHRELAAALVQALADRNIQLRAAHVVNELAAGGRWHCADGCGEGGLIDDPAASPLAMAAVLDGRRLYARRDELQQIIGEGDPARGVALAGTIRELARERAATPRCETDVRRDVQGAIEAALRVHRGLELADAELANLACALADVQVRDTLYGLAVGQRAGQAEGLWALLSRTLPQPWRVEALVLLAFSAYARGDGPLAGLSLEAALRCDPAHRMAVMLDTALQSGMPPEQIRQVALTGYRLADRLGVRLPPRKTSKRRAG